MCAALPFCSFIWIWSKAFPVLHLFSSASSSPDVQLRQNASEKNATSTEIGSPPQFFIGVALTFGFTLMFVVDQIGSYFSMRGKLAELWHQLHFTECHVHTHLLFLNFFISHHDVSYFRSSEQCRHHCDFGTCYSRCRWCTAQHILYIFIDAVVICCPKVHKKNSRPQTWKFPTKHWSCSFPHVTQHVIPSMFICYRLAQPKGSMPYISKQVHPSCCNIIETQTCTKEVVCCDSLWFLYVCI